MNIIARNVALFWTALRPVHEFVTTLTNGNDSYPFNSTFDSRSSCRLSSLGMSTYHEIRLLIDQLDDTKIRQRRAAGERLKEMLSQPEVRRRLALEANPPADRRGHLSLEAARRKALDELWRLVLQSAIYAVESTMKGKSKATISDVLLPYDLMRYCDTPDDSMDPVSVSTRLSKKEVTLFFNYCIEMLEDEVVVDQAELHLLNMLGYVCSRKDYVAFFKPHVEVQRVMEEVELRLTNESRDSATDRVIGAAGSLFEKIIKSTTELGVGLHLLLPACVKMIAKWCASIGQDDVVRSIVAVPHLIGGLAVLIRSDPEQSVAPVTRHGRAILRFCKRRYVDAMNTHRMSFNEYFLSHLIVAQTAGRLEGLMSEDLGNLGPATLTSRQLSSLLELAVGDASRGDDRHLPPSDEKRLALELAARLLACSQRVYHCQAEWDAMQDPFKDLVAVIENLPQADDFMSLQLEAEVRKPTVGSTVVASPFFQYVVRPLFASAYEKSNIEPTSSEETDQSSADSLLIAHPVLNTLARADKPFRNDRNATLSSLRILSACTELFPAGACWTSSSTHLWHEDPHEHACVRVSAPDDLALVVHVTAVLLKHHGGSNGDVDIQRHAILCLCRLTASTAVHSYLRRRRAVSTKMAVLQDAWRQVWLVLFQPDLQYVSWTKSVSAKSNGELFIELLTCIMRRTCPDLESALSTSSRRTSFLYMRQQDIWNLPVFSRIGCDSGLPFSLVYATIHRVGLSEEGIDAIPSVGAESGGRRSRLLSFCFKSLESAQGSPFVGVLSACIAALAHGHAPSLALVIDGFRSIRGTTTSSICFTRSVESPGSIQHMAMSTCLLGKLWTPLSLDAVDICSKTDTSSADLVAVGLRCVGTALHNDERSLDPVDFVSRFWADQLIDNMREKFDAVAAIWNTSDSGPDNPEIEVLTQPVASLPMSIRSVVLKTKMTVLLSRGKNHVASELELLSNELAEIYQAVGNDLCYLFQYETEFVMVLDNLIQITTALVEILSLVDVPCRPEIADGAMMAYKAGKNILATIVRNRDDGGGPKVVSLTPSLGPVIDDLMDDEEEQSHTVEASRKRRRSNGEMRERKRQAANCVQGTPTRQCLVRLASFVIALQPYYEICELVAKTLLGISDCNERIDSDYEIDLLGGFYALILLCRDSTLLRRSAIQKQAGSEGLEGSDHSIVSLVCKILELVRVAAGPNSILHLHGFDHCVRLVQLGDSVYFDTCLQSSEAKDVVGLLKDAATPSEQRSLWLRPHLRKQQLAAAVATFRAGKETFHRHFDREFPRSFVLPCLCDLNGEIRRLASVAVAEAMRLLPEGKVIDSVHKHMAPLWQGKVEEEIRHDYRKWYSDKNLGSSDDNPKAVEQAWEDAFPSMVWGVMECLSVIASASSSPVTVGQVLFDFIRIPYTRPDLDLSCFQMLERLAVQEGFEGAEDLLEANCDGIIKLWLESGISLHELPLTMTAPNILRKLLRSGQSHCLAGINSGAFDRERLRQMAASEYISSHCHVALPRVLYISLGTLMDPSVTKDFQRQILQDESVKDLCSVFYERFGDEEVKLVFRRRLADIAAFTAVLYSLSESDQAIAKEIERLMRGLLSEDHVQRIGVRSLNIALRRFLSVSSQFSATSPERMLMSFKSLLDKYGSDVAAEGKPSRGSVCTTELLVFARFCLCKSPKVLIQDWGPLKIVLDFIAEQSNQDAGERVHIGFCIHTLLDIILDEKLVVVRGKAVDALVVFVNIVCSTFVSLDDEKTSLRKLLKEMFVVGVSVHESCQRKLQEQLQDYESIRRRIFARSLGLLRIPQINSDPWGWSSDADITVPLAFRKYVDSTTVETLEKTYDLLAHVLREGERLGLSPSCMPGIQAIDQSTKSAQLAGMYQSYDLATLLVGSPSNEVTTNDNIQEPLLMKRIGCHEANQSNGSVPSIPLSIRTQHGTQDQSAGQKYLNAELAELEHYLRKMRSAPESSFDQLRQPFRQLVGDLRRYCALPFSDQVRLSAARCLGEIGFAFADPSQILKRPVATRDNFIDEGIRSGAILPSLQARCIERLVVALGSSDTKHAVTASESLRTLLATTSGGQCSGLLRQHDTVNMLKHFLSGSGSSGRGSLLLSSREIESFGVMAGIPKSTDRSMWCWGDALWQAAKSSSFESWICVLVPALLIGNYRREDPPANAEFFSLCERMSCVDSEFAAALFPAIVVDLLLHCPEQNPSEAPSDAVLTDTWLANPSSMTLQRLSRGFECLLDACVSSDGEQTQGQRAVELAVDSLHVLRCLTQQHFCSSKNHKRNTLPGKTGSKAKDPAVNQSSPTHESLSKDSWRGIPYGLVLRLDGLLVAKCCIRAKRYATAVFFAEMYADSRFGGSTMAIDLLFQSSRLSSNSSLTGDISGFGVHRTAIENSGSSVMAVDGLRFLSVLQKAFFELGEQDSRAAIDRRMSDMRFVADESTFSTESTALDDPTSVGHLQVLDNASSQERRRSQATLAIASCFDGLGLRDTLETYVQGLAAMDSDRISESDIAHLKEQWFECRLFDMQWDDDLFCSDESLTAARSLVGTRRLPRGLTADGRRGFFELTTTAMRAFQSDDFVLCRTELAGARTELVESLSALGSEGTAFSTIAKTSDRLQALNDLERALHRNAMGNDSLKWIQEAQSWDSAVGDREFSDCMREVMLRSMYSRVAPKHRGEVRSTLLSHLWHVCEVNLDFGRYKAADGALQRLYAIYKDGTDSHESRSGTKVRLRLQEARLFERRGNFSEAIRLVKQTMSLLQSSSQQLSPAEESLLADALVTCGTWMTKYKVLPATTILTDFLSPGSELAKSLHSRGGQKVDTRRATTSLLALGQLVSSIYETSSSRVKSLEWQRASESLAGRKDELKRCDRLILEVAEKLKRAQSKKNTATQSKEAVAIDKQLRELKIYRINLSREMEQSLSERKRIQSSVSTHRNLALRSFVSALSIAGCDGVEQLSKHVYRLLGLWFSGDPWTQDVDEIVADAIEKVPSFRYVQLTSQLFARIERKSSTEQDGFQQRLQQLVLKMCLDHPYHCLIQLIALSNGNRVGSGGGVHTPNALFEKLSGSKASAATTLIEVLHKEGGYVSKLLESHQTLTEAYYHLAMAPTPDKYRGGAKIAMGAACKSPSQRLDHCLGSRSRMVDCPPCIFTKPPPLRPDCDYGDGIEDPIGTERVASFESHFSITEGGIHRPKIVMCVGSKGGRFRQLVKGEDEMRQDAVMEQVFEYVNELMADRHSDQGSAKAATGSLKVITYNIVPLSPKSGVLEWVEHAVPFGDYMFDKSSKRIGAHSRYYPGEWGVAQCRDAMKEAPQDAKRQVFDEICDNHSPCFRYFFVERFGHSMEAWYEAKTRYTRSVAVNSIVGHALGIGDRHTSNILVHQKTGEVVQIDFGIVFEQGKLLTTPERVPFRLTRNIVDGMGPLGIEGVFTAAAQHTLGVLRRNASALLTILSAVVSDPLYRWSMSPVKARQRQRQADNDDLGVKEGGGDDKNPTAPTETNEGATRAIAKIHEKLQGYEDGTFGEQQSLEGQVQLLINSARDRDNLCQMFPGWAPFA